MGYISPKRYKEIHGVYPPGYTPPKKVSTGASSGYGTYAGGDTPAKTQGWNISKSGNITKNIGNSLVTGVPDGKGGYTFIYSGKENLSGSNLSTVEQTVQSQQGTGDSGGQQGTGDSVEKFTDEFGN